MESIGHYRTAEQVRSEFSARPRRVLVLTTVKHESRAVESHLSKVELVTGSNDTFYQLGTFSDPAGDWSVVHAICQPGNADAAVTASGAYKDFGNFNVQMFIGVAGSLKEDMPIGSVVIGDYVYNVHSGKVDDNGESSRPHSHEGAIELLQAAKILIINESWIDLIKPPVRTTLPDVADYPCPYPPEAEIKAIASGEQVVAGGKTPIYQHIWKFMGDAAAVEMEGFGSMTAARMERTPAIVIRGISDMCDGKDHVADKRYQPIASAHAAAFAFSILSTRSRASPPGPDGGELRVDGDEQQSGPASDPRVEFVVNFKGTPSDWPDDMINSIIEGLRKTTGDPELTLVRVDEGSVRVVISVREKDVPGLTLEAVRTAAGDVGGDLLGAIPAQELTEAEEAKSALRDASADLLLWEQTLPGGGWLERPEKGTIESRFDSDSSSTVLLGEPGSGKSALLASLATDLVKAQASVLAIKADFVSVEVHSEQDLQANLRLPALPSELIERLAQLQPVFLFVDQLDALASQLDLRSDRLNVLLNLVRRVAGLPNVHIVLSARTFEFNHDARLKVIEAEAITLALPAWHQVKENLRAAGVDADTWPDNAREVIRNPQALKIYLSLTKVNDNQSFSKYQSMLEQLWHQKVATAADSEALLSLVSDIAGIMAEEESLWLAASRFDTRAFVLERLDAIGIIVRSENGKSIAFSHQTVFDYVLARSFVNAAGRLSSYVMERQNSLFVRAKLWSALHYLRDAEITSYEREFLEIWRHQDLRRHVRLLLIEFLGEQHNLIAFEIVCLVEAMQLVELRLASLKSIIGNPDWFANFARSAIPEAMAGNDLEANQALQILQRAWLFDADEVVRLLREQWLPRPEKDSFTWAVLDACAIWTEAVEEIAHTILARSLVSSWQVDHTASVVAVEQPDVALRLIRAKLDFLLGQARAISPRKPFPEDGPHYKEQISWQFTDDPTKPYTAILEGMEWNNLPAIAEVEPKKFLEVLWPWFREVFDELKDCLQQDVPDYIFPGNYSVDVGLEDETSGGLSREQPILSSIRLAVEGAVKNDQAYFSNWAEINSDLEFMAAQRLIAHGFGCTPDTYAQQAFNWLFDDCRRLQMGNSYGSRQTTAALISAVSPYWTDEQVRDFESRIQNYQPTTPSHLTEAPQRRRFSQFIRTTRAHLLAAIPFDRLSGESKTLIAAEKRAHGENLDTGIRFTGGGIIGSPMEAEAMIKAKDRDILKILDEVPDNTDWDHPNGWMRGGNIQLSRAFAEFAKIDPVRALRIMEQFRPDAQERAAGYALDSIAEVGGHDQELQDALLDLHQRGFGAEEFLNSSANAIEKIANRRSHIDENVIEMLTEWLSRPMKCAEPLVEEDSSKIIRDEQKTSSDTREESILWGHGGIGILPSGNFPILSALTSILLKGKEDERDRLLAILNNHLLREQDPRVWQALLIRLSHAGGSTPELVSKFLRALFARHPTLLETREAVYFLAYAQRWDDVLVYDLIATWGGAENPMLRQSHGELVGLVSIVHGSERWIKMRDQLFEHGSPEAKIGLAYAGANLWTEKRSHVAAGSLLERLIHGADKTRMSAILDVFRLCDDLVPEPTTLAFLRALAVPEVDLVGAPSTFVVEKLQSLLPHAADIIGAIALKLVNAWRNDLGDFRTSTVIAAPQLTDLAITLHRLGGVSRETGVTVFETLIDLNAYGTRDTLAEIDGRFGVHQASTRRRIARRPMNRAKRRTI